MAVPLVPVVGLLHPERHPAQPRLREEDLQIGQAIEDAGQAELGQAHRRRGAQERQRHPLHDLARPELLEHLGIGARVLEGRLRRARPEAVEADVHRQRHPHVDGRRPEPVVLRLRVRLAVREHAEVDALETEPRAVLELGDRVVEVGPRDDAEADEPVARRPGSTPRRASRCRRGRRRGRRRRRPSCATAAGRPACWGTAPRPAGRPCPARAGAAPAAPRRRCRRRSRRRAARSRWCGRPGGRGTAPDRAAGPRRGARHRRRGA